ncbi:hypothetical protein OU792_02220 [Algoriphagus sp. NF]|nr:hypothetical protein [Algoriphagus sp. NF]
MFLKSSRLSIKALLFVVLWTGFACGISLKNELIYMPISPQEVFASSVSDWDSLELLVPQVGCSSCINLLINEYQEQKIQTRLSMIGVSRERDLRLNYGEEFISNPRVQVHTEIKHRPVASDCFERPALLLSKADTVFYLCFKTDEVQDVISFLAKNE